MTDTANPPKIRHTIRSPREVAVPSPYITVAEDIEWLRDEWLLAKAPPSPPDLRRGSAALRRLLVNGLVTEAWRYHRLAEGPKLVGPDLLAALRQQGYELRHTASAIAGGGEREGVVTSMVGAWRVHNPATGIGPDADEGFAVAIGSIARAAAGEHEPGEYDAVVERVWKLSAYLKAAGAIRVGKPISRNNIIVYFANHAGGVHLGKTAKRSEEQRAQFALIAELERTSSAYDLNGVFFELLSIGQAIGRSPDLLKLAAAIREQGEVSGD